MHSTPACTMSSSEFLEFYGGPVVSFEDEWLTLIDIQQSPKSAFLPIPLSAAVLNRSAVYVLDVHDMRDVTEARIRYVRVTYTVKYTQTSRVLSLVHTLGIVRERSGFPIRAGMDTPWVWSPKWWDENWSNEILRNEANVNRIVCSCTNKQLMSAHQYKKAMNIFISSQKWYQTHAHTRTHTHTHTHTQNTNPNIENQKQKAVG